MLAAEILSQGDEVVTGQTIDSNAAWLSERLTELGATVLRHTAVGDRAEHIVQTMRAASERASIVLSTGGLGPTDDDLTASAVAQAFDLPLVFDPVAMAQIESHYARFGRVMPQVNRKQAWLPTGAVRLDNDWGTAPGFAVSTGSCLLVFMPGVPREMMALFPARVVPLLLKRFNLQPATLVTLRTTGVGESNLQERIGPFDEPDAVLSYRTILPENHIKLRFSPGVSHARMQAVTDRVSAAIGTPLFAVEGLGAPGGSLAEVVGHTLAERGHTVATAESCTGGGVASALTGVPGSSAWFLEGAITYHNAAKVRVLGVQPADLNAHGAVSEPVARQMAEGMRAAAGSTYGLSTTGVAGPGGGSADKPVGTVHIALATPQATFHRRLHLSGGRRRIQSLASSGCLDLLRRYLQGHIH